MHRISVLLVILALMIYQITPTELSTCEKFSEKYGENQFSPDSIDNEYYRDKSGRRGYMLRILNLPTKQHTIFKDKPTEKKDHFDQTINKLGLYDPNTYMNCNAYRTS